MSETLELARRAVLIGGGATMVMDLWAALLRVDGVNGVEAVVVRHAPTGYLSAVNASAFLSSDGHNNEYDARPD